VTIYIPGFMKIGTGIQAIWFWLGSLGGCDVGVTDGRDFFRYTVEMGSFAMMCIPNFIKTGSGMQKLIWGTIHIQTQPTFVFSK
jgi:hypothetical protein